jgi:hypothetical protein
MSKLPVVGLDDEIAAGNIHHLRGLDLDSLGSQALFDLRFCFYLRICGKHQGDAKNAHP